MIRWLHKLTVTEGSLAGQPLKLMAFRRRFIYGVMHHRPASIAAGVDNRRGELAEPGANRVHAHPYPRGRPLVGRTGKGCRYIPAAGRRTWPALQGP